MSKNSETFCIVPWIGAVVGPDQDNLICCRSNPTKTEYTLDSVNTSVHKHLRKTLGEGIKDPICTRCWGDEEEGIPSYRQGYNESYEDLIASDAYDPPKLRFLELTPSNVCNLACRMCTSRFSSKIAARDKYLDKLNMFVPPTWLPGYDGTQGLKPPVFTNWRDLDLTHLQELKLMGGEPMHMKEHIELLEYLDSIDILKDMTITLITNCTHSLSDRWKRVLSKPKRLNLAVSVDSVSPLNDYIRQYSSWDNVEKILHELKNYKDSEGSRVLMTVNVTVGIYNVNKTKEVEDYMKKYDIHHYFNPIIYPDWQALNNLSDDKKEYFMNHPGVTDKIKHVLKHDQNPNEPITNEKFNRETEVVDKFYNKFLKEYNEEIYNLFQYENWEKRLRELKDQDPFIYD